MHKKYCLGIITYFPDDQVIQNIKNLCDQNITIILVDNTPNIEFKLVFNSENIKIIHNKSNLGLSFAMKQLIDIASEMSFESILYLDQDTYLKTKSLVFYKYLDEINAAFDSKSYAIQYLLPMDINMKYGVIIGPNSGSFFNIKFFKKFRIIPSKFFVEMIDFYICLFLRRYKLKSNFIKMDRFLDHSNIGSMTFSIGKNKKQYFRLYPINRLIELFSNAYYLICKAIQFKDLKFILTLIEYLFKLTGTQIFYFLIFSLRVIPFIKNKFFIKELKN